MINNTKRSQKVESSYIKYYLITVLSIVLSLGIINLFVDPYKIFRLVSLEKINQKKPLLDRQGMRTSKSIDLASGNYNVLILGTSRTLNGIDPLHPSFASDSAYNAAFGRTNMSEIHSIFQFANQNNQLKKVIIGLDFLTFSGSKSVSGDFDRSGFSGKNPIKANLTNIVSIDTTIDSLQTLQFNQKKTLEKYKERGFRDYNPQNFNHKLAFDKMLQLVIQGEMYDNFSYSEEKIALLQNIIEECRENNIELHLFISPVHALQLEAIRTLGLWNDFERWKKDLVTITALDAAKYGDTRHYVWDFSGYNSITTEEVPPVDSTQAMKWYRESSHYKKELGNLIINKIVDGESDNLPQDFGVILNSSNIQSHLQQIASDGEKYRSQNAEEISLVQSFRENYNF